MKTFIIKGHKAGTDKWARGKPIRHLDPALLIRKITGKVRLFNVPLTFRANPAHNLTCFPSYI